MNNMIVIHSVVSVIIISLISLVGTFTFLIKESVFRKIIIYLVSFSAGTMLGVAFLHFIPEALGKEQNAMVYVIIGFLSSFVLEKFIKWRYSRKTEYINGKKVHPFAYISLAGDMVHNFIDGVTIAASYIISIPLGISTTIAVMIHEVPHELGDFAVLIHAGFTHKKAHALNLLVTVTAIFGTILGLIVGSDNIPFVSFLIAFTAGNFIYMASSDLIPELHKELNLKNSVLQFLSIILGILFMSLL